MEEDALLGAIERRRKGNKVVSYIKDPFGAFRENPVRIGYLSGLIGASLMVMAYLGDWQFVAPYGAYILAGIIAAIPPAYYIYAEQKRIKKADEKFPDLLRDLAHAKLAGLTLVDALMLTAEGDYGILTDGLKKVAYQLTWGVSFEEAMRLFAKRYPTQIIKRSVTIIVEGYQVGGDVGEILKVAADDVTELRGLEKKRRGDMAPYIIICYVTFFVFLGVLGVLYQSFIPVMVEASKKVASSGRGGFFMAKVDPEALKMLFFHCGVIQGICAGLVAGKLGEGRVIMGLKHAVILALATFVVFWILNIIPPMTLSID